MTRVDRILALALGVLAASCDGEAPVAGKVRVLPVLPRTNGDPGDIERALDSACADLCVNSSDCSPEVVDLPSGETMPIVVCHYPPHGHGWGGMGRRPIGARRDDDAVARTALGAWLIAATQLEAASVPAFHDLRRDLRAHLAPRALQRGARRAARDEVRHARRMAALARRFGAVVPADRPTGSPEVPSLRELAVANAREGCVGELFGAVLARWQARAAADPVARATFARIAVDEARHAELAFAVDRWARGRLGPADRKAVDDARQDALAGLCRAAESPVARQVVETLGVPEPNVAIAVVDALAAVVA